mgnify:FL=1
MEIDVRISGCTPLILNKFTDSAAMSASEGSRSSAAAGSRGTPQEIAEGKLYYGIYGDLIIPSPNLLRCLVDGGTFFKAGRKQITTKAESMLFSCLEIVEAEIPIIHTQPWTVDSRAVVIPATKGRILAHRPRFDDWALDFQISLDTSIVQEKLLREIVDAAGKRDGLGDFRPARKGPYGRFRVDNWVICDIAKAA